MSERPARAPTRGRLFKLFTDFGPYFRKLQSDQTRFFFDCLEICVDATKEPEEREFLGWWMVATPSEKAFTYQRFNGLYDINGDWVKNDLSRQQLQQIDQSFVTFIDKLEEMIDIETGYQLIAEQ